MYRSTSYVALSELILLAILSASFAAFDCILGFSFEELTFLDYPILFCSFLWRIMRLPPSLSALIWISIWSPKFLYRIALLRKHLPTVRWVSMLRRKRTMVGWWDQGLRIALEKLDMIHLENLSGSNVGQLDVLRCPR